MLSEAASTVNPELSRGPKRQKGGSAHEADRHRAQREGFSPSVWSEAEDYWAERLAVALKA
ncbi:hypothetical protein EDD96_6849, partial [Streptomyces sp. Ag109_G2-6]